MRTKALAVTSWRSRQITVNCIAPGLIRNGYIKQHLWKRRSKLIPMQRVGQVHELQA